MKYFDLYASYPDYTIAAAWDSQSKEADKIPSLVDTLTQCEIELYPRFAACYAELRALPRSARRTLQRRLARSGELAAILPGHLQQGGRRQQHRMAWSLAGAALLLALGQGTATAATITVTTNNPNIAADGQCSLIEAIINANNDDATHADCAAGRGADTIVLPANANVTLSAIDNNALGPTGLPLITSGITIEGNGATIARQGNAPAFRVIAVVNPADLTLQRVTLSGGFSSGDGGGVSNGGFSSGVCCGGGLHPGGTLTIKNSIISGNTANSFGGGIHDYSGTLTVENSTISGNIANAGGGLYMSYATVTIKNSTIASNAAIHGGGVYNAPGSYGAGGGSLTITNSTISGNTATDSGGGVSSYGLTINNSTISGNTAINSGGGVDNSLSCFYCGYGVLTLNNSLIAGNQAAVGPEIQSATTLPLNTVIANNFNLFGSNGNAGVTGFTPGPTDIVPPAGFQLTQILGPLANNGGPTDTHALVPGSPAIDTVDPGGCRDSQGALLLTDQRGFARHVDGNSDGTIRCDIGAFEFGAEFVPTPRPPAPPAPPAPTPLVVTATTIATGEAGLSFTSDLMISGGVAPYFVSITKGKLPSGLSLGNDGIISGTLSSNAKSAKITVQVTDSLNDSVTQPFTITVLKGVRISEKAKAGRVGKDYRASFKTNGGRGPFSWSITSGALPPGLNFNTTTGALTGIPTQPGEFPLTVQVTDALGGVDAENVTLKIR